MRFVFLRRLLFVCLQLGVRHTGGSLVGQLHVRLSLDGIVIAAWSEDNPEAYEARENQQRIDSYPFQPLAFCRSFRGESRFEVIEQLHSLSF